MSTISGITGAIGSSYENLITGSKINSASDDPAGLAIAEKEDVQAKGYEVGRNNMASAKDALNIADSALGSVNDYLQRIRELAVSASNDFTVSDSDRAAMQAEVDQLLQGISDVAKHTNYNTKPLLDGSQGEFELATNANGGSTRVSGGDATLKALGIEDFDLTKKFSISTIDDAIEKVNEQRSKVGAQTNGLEYAMNYNSSAEYFVTSSKSRIEDLDYPKEITEQKKQEALLQYAIYMQKQKEEQEASTVNALLGLQ